MAESVEANNAAGEYGGPIPMGEIPGLPCRRFSPATRITLSSPLFLPFSAAPPGKTLKRQKLHGEETYIHSNEFYQNSLAREDVAGSTFLSNEIGAIKVSTTATTVSIDPQDSIQRKGPLCKMIGRLLIQLSLAPSSRPFLPLTLNTKSLIPSYPYQSEIRSPTVIISHVFAGITSWRTP